MWYEMEVNYAQCQAVLDDIDDKDNFQTPSTPPHYRIRDRSLSIQL
jgi:hypothetical protein